MRSLIFALVFAAVIISICDGFGLHAHRPDFGIHFRPSETSLFPRPNITGNSSTSEESGSSSSEESDEEPDQRPSFHGKPHSLGKEKFKKILSSLILKKILRGEPVKVTLDSETKITFKQKSQNKNKRPQKPVVEVEADEEDREEKEEPISSRPGKLLISQLLEALQSDTEGPNDRPGFNNQNKGPSVDLSELLYLARPPFFPPKPSQQENIPYLLPGPIPGPGLFPLPLPLPFPPPLFHRSVNGSAQPELASSRSISAMLNALIQQLQTAVSALPKNTKPLVHDVLNNIANISQGSVPTGVNWVQQQISNGLPSNTNQVVQHVLNNTANIANSVAQDVQHLLNNPPNITQGVNWVQQYVHNANTGPSNSMLNSVVQQIVNETSNAVGNIFHGNGTSPISWMQVPAENQNPMVHPMQIKQQSQNGNSGNSDINWTSQQPWNNTSSSIQNIAPGSSSVSGGSEINQQAENSNLGFFYSG